MLPFRKNVSCALGLAGLLIVSFGPSVAGGSSHRVVALDGDAAPDSGAGTVFAEFSFGPIDTISAVDDQGRVAFLAVLSGPGVGETNDRGVWSEDSGELRLLARHGDPAPGTLPGVFFSNIAEFYSGVFISGGKTAFNALLAGPGVSSSNNVGAWSGPTGGLSLIARKGQAAPGTGADVEFSNVLLTLDPSGASLVSGQLSGPGVTSSNDHGMWSDRGGSLQLAVRTGDPTPEGLPTVLSSIGLVVPNAGSQLLIQAERDGPGIDWYNDEALYFHDSGNLVRILLEGEPAAGAGPGVTYGSGITLGLDWRQSINDLGHSAFRVDLSVTGGPSTHAIFSDHTGELAPMAQGMDPAPGTDEIFNLVDNPVLSDAGRLAFRGTIASTLRFGIWWDQAAVGEFQPLVLPGDVIPDAYVQFVSARRYWYNAAGRLLVACSTAELVSGSRDSLLLAEPDGSLRLLVRVGAAFDVFADGSDVRTIHAIDAVGLAENGSAVFHLDFTDGSSGIFATTAIGGVSPGRSDNLRVAKGNGGTLDLTWDEDCGNGTTYGIYRGDLTAGPASLQPEPGFCSVSGTGAAVPQGAGATEFLLVVPNDGTSEGSYGFDSAGNPRPTAGAACWPTASIDSCALP